MKTQTKLLLILAALFCFCGLSASVHIACASSSASTKESAADMEKKKAETADAERKLKAGKIDDAFWKDMLLAQSKLTILQQNIQLMQIELTQRQAALSEANTKMRAEYGVKPEDKISEAGVITRVSKTAAKP